MSYRVDIPTLSANEVYTLTFEYEGAETIQLIVGDLTLETTDRRVVFTTTSPVNYIESNMNLTNLNIYEGYYESDDFGGEYTQESIIEGKSLVNYHDFNRCNLSFNNETQGKWEFLDDGFARMTTLDVNYNHCRPKPTNYTSEATYTVATWVRNFNSEAGNVVFECFHYLDMIKTIKFGEPIITGIDSGTHHYSPGQEGLMISVGKYTGITTKIVNGTHHQYMGNFGTTGGFVSGDSVEIFVMVLEGDKADDILNGLIQPFHGIGCVKSPKIVSYPKYPNIAPNCKRDLSNVTPTAYRSDDNSYIKITNTARWVGVSFGYYPQDFGYGSGDIFCLEFDVIDYKGTGTISNGNTSIMTLVSGEYLNSTGGVCYIDKIGHYKEYFICNGNSENGRVCLISVHLNTGTGGINTLIEIDNLKVYKIDSVNDINVYEYEDCKVSTPDDLELYSFTDTWDKKTIVDTLDLTTGIVTKNVGVLDITDINALIYSGYDSTNDLYNVSCSFANFPNIVTKGNDTLVSSNILERNWYTVEGLFSHGVNGKFEIRISGTRGITSGDEAKQWVIDNLIMFYERTPEIIQLDINVLKSYRNGSIQTSSQQLAPTLKTTLPISNKFTTTNLTSGLTYNVYFDGTATKLDAGGTIITDPVSPCEVECGGTTLTIEGTDIQNVRVLETTVKNEVGSVCGTTDVELSKIKTKCGIHNMFDDYIQGSHNTSWAKDYQCTSTRDDTTVKIVGKGSLNYAGYSLVESLPFGTYKLHYKVKVSTIGDKYKVALSSNPNGTPQDSYVPVTDVTSTALVEEQTFVFYKKHITNMLFYTYYKGQEIEYYDISLIKLSDEDITGTDTSSINYSQVICDLEQPIKLRSLGETYDSYNPVTGELTKRIGVSETDGSYSVLSSPVVENISMGKTIENIFNFEEEWINRGLNTSNAWQLTNDGDGIYTLKALQANATARVWFSLLDAEQTVGEELTTIIEVFKNTSNKSIEYWSQIQLENGNDVDYLFNAGETGVKIQYGKFKGAGRAIDFQKIGKDSEFQFRVTIVRGLYPNIKEGFGTSKIIQVPPHLYTNGQVKVYSDSEVYPTTILNGQSTNNYEVNELNRYNNYTIRYEGECESINLNGKSNEQGTNRIVKTSTDGRGNLTFVNNSGDIDNVLLVEHDVREQEINHFYGLQTVEVNQLFISSKQNLFEAYMKNDFDYEYVTSWNTSYSSLHRGVFNCGVSVAGNNTQLTFDLIHPKIGGGISEETPIMKAGQIYNISCDITVNDDTSNRKYEITFYTKSGSQIYAQKVDNILPVLSLNTTADNTNTTAKINVNTFFNEDVHGIRLHAIYGGGWVFDCTITNFTICEPENAKPDVPLVYEYIDLPQPVQLNRIHKENMPYGAWSNVLGQHVNLANGIAYDSYNPITGEYIQRVYKMTLNGDDGIKYIDNWSGVQYAINDSTLPYPRKARHADTTGRYAGLIDVDGVPYGASYNAQNDIFVTWLNLNAIVLNLPRKYTNNVFNQNACKQWLRENPIVLFYELDEPIVTQLTPINIPTFEGGIVQLITTDGKVFPMVEYSMPTNNRYDTSSWEAGAVYTQRNMTEAYFNESTTPMIPTETTTLTTDHISSGSIILNDNGNGLIVLKGNYTGRDIPYFTGMRSVEAIEVETTPSPDQPLFGKGGRK